MAAVVYAVCNQKGGCAKTVTSVNLGIGLACEGKRVLLVDVDSQGSLTASLGWQHPDQMETTLATILGMMINEKPVSPDAGILHHEEGVDLLPANIELAGLEVALVNTMSRESILRQYLNIVRDKYDVVILDCMPSLGMLTINALAAADKVLILVQAQYLSIKGMEQLFRTIAKVKRQINQNLSIAGIVITMADMRTNYAKAGIKMVPCIMRELSDEEAVILMVDSNIQREELLFSEKAFAYKMKLEAMKKQGRRTDLACGQIDHRLKGKNQWGFWRRMLGKAKNRYRDISGLRNFQRNFWTRRIISRFLSMLAWRYPIWAKKNRKRF